MSGRIWFGSSSATVVVDSDGDWRSWGASPDDVRHPMAFFSTVTPFNACVQRGFPSSWCGASSSPVATAGGEEIVSWGLGKDLGTSV